MKNPRQALSLAGVFVLGFSDSRRDDWLGFGDRPGKGNPVSLGPTIKVENTL